MNIIGFLSILVPVFLTFGQDLILNKKEHYEKVCFDDYCSAYGVHDGEC